MTNWLTILIALWTYPIIGFFLLRLTKKNLELRKNVFIVTTSLTIIAILGFLTKISTTLSVIDWIIITAPFLLFCISLWWTVHQPKRLIKIIGITSMILSFSLVYVFSTVGALGIGFVSAKFETDNEKWFENGLIYKENILGNALTDHRGKRIEIYRTISWFPVIEWHVKTKEYSNLMVYEKTLNVSYDPIRDEFYLDLEKQWRDSTYYWNDTIKLKQ